MSRLQETKDQIQIFFRDIRYLTLFPKRCPAVSPPKDRNELIKAAFRSVGNLWRIKNRVDRSAYHWYIVTFKDGHKELTYLKSRYAWWGFKGGVLYRGLIFPRRATYRWSDNVDSIRLAF